MQRMPAPVTGASARQTEKAGAAGLGAPDGHPRRLALRRVELVGQGAQPHPALGSYSTNTGAPAWARTPPPPRGKARTLRGRSGSGAGAPGPAPAPPRTTRRTGRCPPRSEVAPPRRWSSGGRTPGSAGAGAATRPPGARLSAPAPWRAGPHRPGTRAGVRSRPGGVSARCVFHHERQATARRRGKHGRRRRVRATRRSVPTPFLLQRSAGPLFGPRGGRGAGAPASSQRRERRERV